MAFQSEASNKLADRRAKVLEKGPAAYQDKIKGRDVLAGTQVHRALSRKTDHSLLGRLTVLWKKKKGGHSLVSIGGIEGDLLFRQQRSARIHRLDLGRTLRGRKARFVDSPAEKDIKNPALPDGRLSQFLPGAAKIVVIFVKDICPRRIRLEDYLHRHLRPKAGEKRVFRDEPFSLTGKLESIGILILLAGQSIFL